MQEKMVELKSEVNSEIGGFMETAAQLKEETASRIKTLKKIKKKYKHLEKKKAHLK
jgi:hypothetical protein